ncbi:MAG: hypothetical protein JXL97_12495 [Bacteroidales bacterium]|nr:hypothetical protein [Bacteroidales bacterium]
MKQIIYSVFIFIALIMVSCNPETIVDMTITPSNILAKSGDTIVFNIVMTPDISNNGIVGELVVDDGEGNRIFTKNYSSKEIVEDSCEYNVPLNLENQTEIVLRFSVMDESSGVENAKTASITISSGVPAVYQYADIQGYFDNSSLESNMIFDLTETAALTKSANFSDGELAFVWSDAMGHSIVSPNATCIQNIFLLGGISYSVMDKQETKIMTYSGLWTDLDDEAINNLVISTETVTEGGNGVSGLTEGDILVFETEDGRKGAVKISTLIKDTKYIAVDFIYQGTVK